MVGVAKWLTHRIVIPASAGSNPVTHPIIFSPEKIMDSNLKYPSLQSPLYFPPPHGEKIRKLETWISEIRRDKKLDRVQGHLVSLARNQIIVSSTSFLGGFFMTTEFLFEKLEVYQRSLTFVEAADDLISQLKGQIPYSRADQLSRASLSIPLNIAEGNGRYRPNDRRQFFTVARGSAFECVPILQIMLRKGLLEPNRYQGLYSELHILAKMLTKLMQREESKVTS